MVLGKSFADGCALVRRRAPNRRRRLGVPDCGVSAQRRMTPSGLEITFLIFWARSQVNLADRPRGLELIEEAGHAGVDIFLISGKAFEADHDGPVVIPRVEFQIRPVRTWLRS